MGNSKWLLLWLLQQRLVFSATACLLACVKLLTGVLFSLCKPCKAVHPTDVDAMYVELLQRCKQMYLTEAETVDDHLYQLPSFLQSIASVILHLDTVSGVFKVPVKKFLMQPAMYEKVVTVNLKYLWWKVFRYLKYYGFSSYRVGEYQENIRFYLNRENAWNILFLNWIF